jgi:hypothetical protein
MNDNRDTGNRDTGNRDPVNRDPVDRDNVEETAPASSSSLTGGAVAALTTLGTTLNNVNVTSIVGGSGRPMLLFKSRDNGGTWMVGQKKIVVEEGSTWAVNPTTFQRGYISFDDKKKVVGEKLLPVSLSMIDRAKLPDTGFPWQEEWTVDIKCLDGADAGKEVIFKASTVGSIQAIGTLIAEVRDRINGGAHDGKPVPIVLLEKYDYQHPQYGKTINPLLTIVDWMPLDGPAPTTTTPTAPSPTTSPAAEQPRRRRVS